MYGAKMLLEKQGFIVIPYKVDCNLIGNSIVTLLDLVPSAENLAVSNTGIRDFIEISYIHLNVSDLALY